MHEEKNSNAGLYLSSKNIPSKLSALLEYLKFSFISRFILGRHYEFEKWKISNSSLMRLQKQYITDVRKAWLIFYLQCKMLVLKFAPFLLCLLIWLNLKKKVYCLKCYSFFKILDLCIFMPRIRANFTVLSNKFVFWQVPMQMIKMVNMFFLYFLSF